MATGLSPRGRGNRAFQVPFIDRHRSIPAWAGQPLFLLRKAPGPWVYPRVGGATTAIKWGSRSMRGLSPRGRGNLGQPAALQECRGSIPAWAGQPKQPSRWQTLRRVYPRVGGAPPGSQP